MWRLKYQTTIPNSWMFYQMFPVVVAMLRTLACNFVIVYIYILFKLNCNFLPRTYVLDAPFDHNINSTGWKSSVYWARFLSLARSKLSLCSANHRPGYWSYLSCDWPNTGCANAEQETENVPWWTNGRMSKYLTPLFFLVTAIDSVLLYVNYQNDWLN